MRTAAVVGAAGFVGAALVRSLETAGVDVVPFTREAPCLSPDGRVDPHVCDADTVYWVATSTNPAIAESFPDRVARDHDQLETFLGQLTRMTSNPPTVIFTSSGGAMYGATAAPFRERDEVRPITAYGRAKAALEELLATSPVPSVSVRISNVYGPGQPAFAAQGVIAYWLKAVTRGEPVSVFGDLSTTRDYVYLDDVVDAMTGIGRSGVVSDTVVNIGRGEPTSLGELIAAVCQVTGLRHSDVEFLPGRSFDLRDSWLDISRARNRYGWTPKYDLEDGLRATWAHVLATVDQDEQQGRPEC